MIKDKSVQSFLDELAGKASTPGGGSAAAVMGAMGAALLSMVANLTVGKKNYESVEEDMQKLLKRTEELRGKLTDAIEADVEVFDKVMAAYGMPRDDEEAKARRSSAIQTALKEATDVPLECARQCAEVIRLSEPVAEMGNTNVISDAGVAVMAAYAALRSAALNVYINIGGIRDEDFVEERRGQLEETMEGMDKLTEEVYALVKSKL
ncbi:MAG: cyclodeaminase/cyclohydrolase family protein [Gammaproteobacteria bacterium]|jgi:formiminotetrahydrofolate cyclodeaminase